MRIASLPTVLALGAILGPCGFPAHGATNAPSPPAFTDVSAASGLARIRDDKYAADPKWWLSGVDLIDLDGDGHLDLFLGAHANGHAVAALNDGHGRFTRINDGIPTREVYLPVDLDADGKVDLLVTHEDGAGRWWINRSTAGRVRFERTNLGTARARTNAAIDLDRDGRLDWLHDADSAIAFEAFAPAGGAWAFSPFGKLDVPRHKNETNVIPVDLNGDGHPDLVVHWGRYDVPAGKSRLYLNDGKGHFADATHACGLAEDGLAIKGVGDVNQDGTVDLLVLEQKRPALYLNDGKGHFTRKADALQGMEDARRAAYASWGMGVVVDLDNDGTPDILWNGRNFLWALQGVGGGRFRYANKAWGIEDNASATVDDGLCFGDIDGDGALDVIGYAGALDGQRRLRVYRNDLARGPGRGFVCVQVNGRGGNRCAAGAKIRATDPAAGSLIAFEPVLHVGSQSAHTYYARGTTERHIGIGDRGAVDVSVEFYPSGKGVTRKGVPAGQTVRIEEPG